MKIIKKIMSKCVHLVCSVVDIIVKSLYVSHYQEKYLSDVFGKKIIYLNNADDADWLNGGVLESNAVLVCRIDGEKFNKLADYFFHQFNMTEGVHFCSDLCYDKYIQMTHRKIYTHVIHRGIGTEWKKIEYFSEKWNTRAKKLCDYINVNCESVMDLGCGEGYVEKYLGETRPRVKYMGVDYKKRNSNTIECDFNKHEFPNNEPDCILVSGCMEYVSDAKWFLHNLKNAKKQIVISYCSMSRTPDIKLRRELGWESHLTTLEIIHELKKDGFALIRTDEWDGGTVLFDFMKNYV